MPAEDKARQTVTLVLRKRRWLAYRSMVFSCSVTKILFICQKCENVLRRSHALDNETPRWSPDHGTATTENLIDYVT